MKPIEKLEEIKLKILHEIVYEYKNGCGYKPTDTAYEMGVWEEIAMQINSTTKKEKKFFIEVMEEFDKQREFMTLEDFRYTKHKLTKLL